VVADARRLPDSRVHVWYEGGDVAGALDIDGVHAGLMDLSDVDLPDDAGYYLCGPVPFMQAVRSGLIDRGVAPRDIQYEVFGPDLWQADFETEDTPGVGHHALSSVS